MQRVTLHRRGRRLSDSFASVRRTGAFSALEVVMVVALAGLVNVLSNPQTQGPLEYLSYRSTLNNVASAIRGMRYRAISDNRMLQMRIDSDKGMLQLIELRAGPGGDATIKQTVWLPDGLAIVEAPDEITVLPSGRFASSTIVVDVPTYQHRFRLTTSTSGMVQLYEEPSG